MAVREWRKCVSCVQYWVVSVDGGKTWKGGASCGQAPWSCLVREREHKHRADMSGARTRLEYLVAELKGQQRRRHSLSVPCMYRNHQNSTNANLSMLRCSPYFETSIRHVMLLLKPCVQDPCCQKLLSSKLSFRHHSSKRKRRSFHATRIPSRHQNGKSPIS